ncbi:MAG: eukaryotic-like serine/threonine-protein kinase [Mucilaginibacter sp.]|nr:eukaryotic-like serine/threonine-protein kinase [Mucilaginibacter sp.]
MSKIFTITEGLENMGALRTGGQGSVYKGRRMGPIISAVKLLPTPIYSEDDEDKNFRNFQNEVEKLKKVNEDPNPNVVKILNSGVTESGSLPFIEMEYIEGPDLEELLKPPHDGIFTIKEVIKLADHLANALAHCHKVGVKHGDIKSNNVKYNVHSGNYVLLDFGLAIMSDEQRRTSIRHAGAIEFMAPEQNTGAMLFQTDVYGFGIILYELLAGQVPFPLHDSGETSRNAVMIAHMETPVPDVLELRRKNLPENWSAEKKVQEMRVPQWLLQITATCLEKDPENRYSNGMVLQEGVIAGSIDTNRSESASESIDILKAKNNELTTQLFAYQSNTSTSKQVKITKPALAGLIVCLIAALAFGSYESIRKRDPVVVRDTIFIKPKALVHKQQPLPVRKDSIKPIVTAGNPASKQVIVTDTSAKAKKAALARSHKKKRKKKKKFLGIF